jgi:hypothetical protein
LPAFREATTIRRFAFPEFMEETGMSLRMAKLSLVAAALFSGSSPADVRADEQPPAGSNVGGLPPQMQRLMSSATGLPFFGQMAVTPDPVQFREFVEKLSLPNGEVHAVKRRVPAQPWMLFKVRFIVDSSGSLEQFASVQKTGQMVADSESLDGTLRILEANKLVSPIDGESSVSQELSPLISGGLHSERKVFDEATGQERPADVTDWLIDIMPTDVRGQLHVSIKLQYVLNGRMWEATPTAEIGRGQSLLARMKPVPNPAAADARQDNKPRYLLLTPSIAPLPAPEPDPFAAVPIPTTAPPSALRSVPAIWAHQPELAPAEFTPPQPEQTFPSPNPASEPGLAAVPAVDENRAAARTIKQIKYEIDVIEDLSDSMMGFMPPTDQPACQLVDSTSIRAVLRILKKQQLVRTISDPRLVAAAGEPATMRVGSETPNAETLFDGLNVEVLGQVLGGGMSIEFKLLRTDVDRKIDASLAMLVAHGQTIIVRADWKDVKQASGKSKPPQGAADKKKPANPVYIVITPELLR